jgi:hypothetical protein
LRLKIGGTSHRADNRQSLFPQRQRPDLLSLLCFNPLALLRAFRWERRPRALYVEPLASAAPAPQPLAELRRWHIAESEFHQAREIKLFRAPATAARVQPHVVLEMLTYGAHDDQAHGRQS